MEEVIIDLQNSEAAFTGCDLFKATHRNVHMGPDQDSYLAQDPILPCNPKWLPKRKVKIEQARCFSIGDFPNYMWFPCIK